jgi:hypothetical protein
MTEIAKKRIRGAQHVRGGTKGDALVKLCVMMFDGRGSHGKEDKSTRRMRGGNQGEALIDYRYVMF